MPANIAFYVHHHGSGHVMRCVAISKSLPRSCNITFLGSRLEAYHTIIPDYIQCVHLSMDTPVEDDIYHTDEEPPAGLHYAPHHIAGQQERVSAMANFFATKKQLLLIIDVSVEVAMLARLCGIPFIVVRQHGNRDDLPHMLAYQNAQLLIAPYAAMLKQQDPEWLDYKTFYMGGYCRFGTDTITDTSVSNQPHRAAVLIGSGGTSLNLKFICHLAQLCPGWHFDIVGKIEEYPGLGMPSNATYHGHMDDPSTVLKNTAVIIGNTGHNTVMEVASLGKRFITVPEDRPFNEQEVKAGLLSHLRMAVSVPVNQLYRTNWLQLLESTDWSLGSWQNMIDEQALNKAAGKIMELHNQIYKANAVTV